MSLAAPYLRCVLDTNVLLAGLASQASASQRIVDGLQLRRALPILSRPVLDEYRRVLLHPLIAARFPNLTAQRVTAALDTLRFVADEYHNIGVQFQFPRDPRDAKFIELAIAGKATHLISLDPDLLDLPTSRTDAGKRFRQRLPAIKVVKPAELLAIYGSMFIAD